MLKDRIIKKAGNKLASSMPSLINFAVENDKGYNALINTMKKINVKRKEKRKYVTSSI